MPFLIEGAIQGIISGIAAVSILFLLYVIFSIDTIHVLGFPVLDISFISAEGILIIIVSSLLLGTIGGLIAIGRFFKF